MNKVLGNKKAIALFILPAVILFTCLVFIPLIWSFVYTFFSGQPGLDFKFAGMKNYARIFADKSLWVTVKNNLLYVVVVGGAQIILGFLIAMLINFGVKKHQNLVRTLLFVPVVLPGVAVAQMFIKIYAITPQYGLLNSFFSAVGLDSLVKGWIGDPKTDPRIGFVGGIRGYQELERRVHEDCAAAFAMYPTSIQELFAVADTGRLMPPKSTWFEPKLRSGLYIHAF